jgi:2-haloacid dehalogenase/putative hydrolase of the HAD superfamily
MPIKALLIDFHGTLAKEDDGQIKDICRQVCESSPQVIVPAQVARFWWERMEHYALTCYGDKFRPQRELEMRTIEEMLAKFEAHLPAAELAGRMADRWRKPEAWHDARMFMSRLPLQACLLVNGDRADVESAAAYTQIDIPRLLCSEDAQAYKPRAEIFTYALRELNVAAADTLMIGDSIHYDLMPAARLGIRTAWINRHGRPSGEFQPDVIYSDLMDLRRLIR